MQKRKRNGFTMIELLVVITVIGILAGLIVTNFSSARQRARDTKRKADFRALKTALRLYYNDYQRYPASTGSGQIQGCGANGTSTCNWGATFGTTNTEYLKAIPTDPLNTGSYVYDYEQVGGGDGFTLTTTLENISDGDDATSQTLCGLTFTNNRYVVCED